MPPSHTKTREPSRSSKAAGRSSGTSSARTGGSGARVDKPAALQDALAKAYASVQAGKTAIVNVMLNE